MTLDYAIDIIQIYKDVIGFRDADLLEAVGSDFERDYLN